MGSDGLSLSIKTVCKNFYAKLRFGAAAGDLRVYYNGELLRGNILKPRGYEYALESDGFRWFVSIY